MTADSQRPASELNFELGPGPEFDLIRSMLSKFGALAHGVGDDAALVDVPEGARLAVSTDVSVENVHFRRDWLTPKEIAYRSAAAALSDLAAMGATPLGMVIAVNVSELWRAAIPKLAEGFAAAASALGTPIVGGDLSEGTELSICVTVLGSVKRALTRAGAHAGDTLYVTGLLGGPLLALRAFERGETPLAEHRERFATPVPRLLEGQWLAAHGATAAIDCSDGAASDAGHLAAASRVKIVLELDHLPMVPGATHADAAASGEEYELIVTAPATLDLKAFEREFALPLTAIGRVEPADAGGPGVEAVEGARRVPLPRGHSHFSG